MAPEQVLGNRPVDGRADLYALGCVAYWLVTGQPVFPGSSPIDTIVKHVSAAPDPPSRHSWMDVSPEFDALVLECLSKDPDQRPATADAVANRLRGLSSGRGWTKARAADWWETHGANLRLRLARLPWALAATCGVQPAMRTQASELIS